MKTRKEMGYWRIKERRGKQRREERVVNDEMQWRKARFKKWFLRLKGRKEGE